MIKKHRGREGSSAADIAPGPTSVPPPAQGPGRKTRIVRSAMAALAAVLGLLLVICLPVRAWAMNWGAT
ncbi:MAG TPA: hypothetical protein VF221_03950 [Chloroflexota bacterium]